MSSATTAPLTIPSAEKQVPEELAVSAPDESTESTLEEGGGRAGDQSDVEEEDDIADVDYIDDEDEEEDDDDDTDSESSGEDTADWDPVDENAFGKEKMAVFALPSHLKPVAGESLFSLQIHAPCGSSYHNSLETLWNVVE